MTKRQPYPLRRQWDITVGSPQSLFRSLEDLMKELGYKEDDHQKRAPVLKATDINDTALFDGFLVGHQKWRKHRLGVLIIGSLLMIVSIVAIGGGFVQRLIDFQIGGGVGIVIGLVLLVLSSRSLYRTLEIRVVGESYKAGASSGTLEGERGRVGLVSEARLVIDAGIRAKIDGDWIRRRFEPTLEADFATLQTGIEGMLPTLTLPSLAPALRAASALSESTDQDREGDFEGGL